jgi:hypothetical protein
MVRELVAPVHICCTFHKNIFDFYWWEYNLISQIWNLSFFSHQHVRDIVSLLCVSALSLCVCVCYLLCPEKI